MEQRQILELALEALEKQKAEVEAAIAEIRELQGGNSRITRAAEGSSIVVLKRRAKTPAERKAQSLRMKKFWAAKRSQATRKSATLKKTQAAGVKFKTAAQKKALSLAMKEAWKRRKAEEAKKTKD